MVSQHPAHLTGGSRLHEKDTCHRGLALDEETVRGESTAAEKYHPRCRRSHPSLPHILGPRANFIL
jgi:hypothetical protein